ncbi:MAG: class I SAM-dependent methyltransferase [Bdellovibrionota bacterium]
MATFAFNTIEAHPSQRALFVGGMFDIAGELTGRGLVLTVVDYTSEMVEIGQQRLPEIDVARADLRDLPFDREFDLIFVIGRVFTHMLNDFDLTRAIRGCFRALKPGGRLLADNYESSRIEVTNYFNGVLEYENAGAAIVRRSSTRRISESPRIVRWDAEYSGRFGSEPFRFQDSMEHRAFERAEFAEHLRLADFDVIAQGDNFDETSFYTVAARKRE